MFLLNSQCCTLYDGCIYLDNYLDENIYPYTVCVTFVMNRNTNCSARTYNIHCLLTGN